MRNILILLSIIFVSSLISSCSTASSSYTGYRLKPSQISEILVYVDGLEGTMLKNNETLKRSLADDICNVLKSKGLNTSTDMNKKSYSHVLVVTGEEINDGGNIIVCSNAVLGEANKDYTIKQICQSKVYGDGTNIAESRFANTTTGRITGKIFGGSQDVNKVYKDILIRAATAVFTND